MAASMRNPVVVILGATGTGKTKLSLELAKLFNGEIISADSMQLYKGLDIITNKATFEEMRICRHHMIDYISPLTENSTVVEYRNTALPIIDSLLSSKKTPIIVGGSNYYIESLLWKHLLNSEDIKKASEVHRATQQSEVQQSRVKGGESGEAVMKVADDKVVVADGKVVLADGKVVLGDDKLVVAESVISDSTPDSKDVGCETKDNVGKLYTETEARHEHMSDNSDSDEDPVMRADRDIYECVTSRELHDRLKQVDPVYAEKLHPNDKRKLIRALEVYDRYGVPMSEVHKAQHSSMSDNALGGPLRYTDTCVFWIQCDKYVLDKRLDARVDTMMEQGLVAELTDFHTQYNEDRIKHGREADYTRGIFQSIGFKEFHEYLLLSNEDRQTDDGKKALKECVEDLKQATRKYARYQLRWLERRLLQRPCVDNVPTVYGLDGTDVSSWEENVSRPATTILTALRRGEESPIPPLPYREKNQQFVYNECKVCEVVTVTLEQWNEHITSRKHKKRVGHHRKMLAQVSQTLDTHIHNKRRKSEEPVDIEDMQEIFQDTFGTDS